MARILLLLALLMFLSGCVDSYTCTRFEGQSPPRPLSRQASVYVSRPNDGWYGDEHGERSGADTAQVVAEAFLAHVIRVEQAKEFAETDANIAAAAAGHFTYFADPLIIHWEDRATEWSGKPDRITVQITLYEVMTKQIVDRVTIKGTSKWATFGGDHPQDLLAKPIEKYVAELFAGSPPPAKPSS